MRDLDLLRRYSRDGSQEAFTELVGRHVDAIYSAAMRQVRSPDLAWEVAQSVFLDLAKRATELREDSHILSWLYVVTRRTSVDVIRRESRRIHHEVEAAEGAALTNFSSQWARIEPLFDAAIESLSESDRKVVLLRFFEKRPFREIGALLGLSEDAAKKRVRRAVAHLRDVLSAGGILTSAELLEAEMAPNAVQEAPFGLTASIAQAIELARPLAPHAVLYKTAQNLTMTFAQKISVVAVIAIATASGLYQHRFIAEQAKLIDSLKRQLPSATVRGAPLKQRRSVSSRNAAANTGASAAGQAGRADVRTFRSFQDLLAAQARQQLPSRYGPLFEALDLSPEKLRQLEALLIERQLASRDALNLALKSVSIQSVQNVSKNTPIVLGPAPGDAVAPITQEIQTLLGSQGYQQLQQYEQTLPERLSVEQVQQALNYTSVPLTDAQSQQLIEVIAANSNTPDTVTIPLNGPLFVNDAASITDDDIQQARAFLAPTQLQALQDLQSAQQATHQMQQMVHPRRSSQ